MTGVTLYSTLTRRKEPLEAGPGGVVRIYFCGPTVYGRVHIGNARPFVVFSVLKRHLERRGTRVRLVSNLTDVNDKIYAAARAEGVPSTELAERYSRAYVEDTDRLGLGRPDAEPTVTGSIDAIVTLIAELVDRGLAYAADGDVYFRVARFPGYGRLSGRRPEELPEAEPGGRKESPLDFALWKARKPDEDAWWESPWGPGRPGWHIECSAMAETCLGHGFEVHGGGLDLVFPHHENEIAQSEGARGGRMAAIWMHNGMLELAGDKMSKSVGNIAPLATVLDEWPAEVVVAYFLTSHYRSRLPFSPGRMAEARALCERLSGAIGALDRAIAAGRAGDDGGVPGAVAAARAEFTSALDDDLNTPEALAALARLIRVTNAAAGPDGASADVLREARRGLLAMLDTLGLAGLAPPPADGPPPDVGELVARRELARAARDWAEADALREAARGLGYEVTDTPEGPRVEPS